MTTEPIGYDGFGAPLHEWQVAPMSLTDSPTSVLPLSEINRIADSLSPEVRAQLEAMTNEQ